jgi:hypothetical protein
VGEFLALGVLELDTLEEGQPGPGMDLGRTRKAEREDVKGDVMQVDDCIKNKFGDVDPLQKEYPGLGTEFILALEAQVRVPETLRSGQDCRQGGLGSLAYGSETWRAQSGDFSDRT